MNAKTQFDFHPDAESLSAFSERALSDGERGQIAAHLAVCERCRQVVFLAQEAATAEENLAAAGSENVRVRRPWFRSWWIVWAPTAALATVVALAFYVHAKRTEADKEMAKATQEVSPLTGAQNGAAASRPMEAPRAETGKTAVETQPRLRAPMAHSNALVGTVKGKVVNGGTEHVVLPPAPVPPPPMPTTASEAAPAAAVAAQANGPMRAGAMAEQQTTEHAAEEHAQGEMHGTAQASATRHSLASPAPLAGFAASRVMTRALAVQATKIAALPSGLPAVSTAAGSRVTLAVDKTGAVFVSVDNGENWVSVARQWSGRAVTVRIATAPGVFELVNDQGQMWVSTDGRVWTAK